MQALPTPHDANFDEMLFPNETGQDHTVLTATNGQHVTPSRLTCKDQSLDGMLPNPQDLRQSPAKQLQSEAFNLSDTSSIFKNNISDSLSRIASQHEKTFKAPHQIIKFEIYVDYVMGTQIIEICDRKQISETVETFALKYDITSKAKVAKLKKYIKQQWKEKQEGFEKA
jgi:hypothetical protein